MMNPEESGCVINFSDGLRKCFGESPYTIRSPKSGLGQFDLDIYTTWQFQLRQGVDSFRCRSVNFNKTLVRS